MKSLPNQMIWVYNDHTFNMIDFTLLIYLTKKKYFPNMIQIRFLEIHRTKTFHQTTKEKAMIFSAIQILFLNN